MATNEDPDNGPPVETPGLLKQPLLELDAYGDRKTGIPWEQKVEEYLQALGYKTRQRAVVNGVEMDIIGRHRITDERVVCSCKDWLENKIRKPEITDLCAKAVIADAVPMLAMREDFDDHVFSDQLAPLARRLVKHHQIKLVTDVDVRLGAQPRLPDEIDPDEIGLDDNRDQWEEDWYLPVESRIVNNTPERRPIPGQYMLQRQ